MGCGKSVAVAREGDQGHAAAGARALQANKSTANVAVGALVDSTGVQDTGHCNPREAADMFNKAKFGRCSYEACRVPKVLLPDLGAKRANQATRKSASQRLWMPEFNRTPPSARNVRIGRAARAQMTRLWEGAARGRARGAEMRLDPAIRTFLARVYPTG